jgi:precorrin-6A/cobalt-precorrin-6A reductase
LLIDATHPYAARMSRNVCESSASTGVPCWAIRRPAWTPQPGDDWRDVAGWSEIVARIAPYRRVLWTLGREPLAKLDAIPPSQHWTIRCLDAHEGNARATVIGARGPFSIEGERALFDAHRIDVVVSKNSGGGATEAKLAVARELRVPVVMLQRPVLPPATREFDGTSASLQALAQWLDPDQPLTKASV